MKEKILEFLKQQEGFISGQRICDELGVSRTAVWKYMNSLKKEGYEIESVTRKGYRLLQSPDLLTREAVLSCIKKGEIPGELCCFESIDSTNEEAKRRGEAGAPDGSIYVADNQTNGKGRRGRTWLSPSGEDIFFTILLRPDLPLNSVSMLTLVAASAVAEAVDKVTGQECQIKWPNDIVLNRKKVCGILTEMNMEIDSIAYVVVGVGIGGTFEKAAILAKKALMRPLDTQNPDPFYADLEKEMLEKVNKLGIGPQGFGGKTTAIGLNIETMPTHIAGMPCAININCHVTRHKTEVI